MSPSSPSHQCKSEAMMISNVSAASFRGAGASKTAGNPVLELLSLGVLGTLFETPWGHGAYMSHYALRSHSTSSTRCHFGD